MSGTPSLVQRNSLFYLLTQVVGITLLLAWLASLAQQWTPVNPLLAMANRPAHVAHEMKEVQWILMALMVAGALLLSFWQAHRLGRQAGLPVRPALMCGAALFLGGPLLAALLQSEVVRAWLDLALGWAPLARSLVQVDACVAVGAGLVYLYFVGWALNLPRLRWTGLLAGLLCAVVLGVLEPEQGRVNLVQVFSSLMVVWLLCSLVFYPLIVAPRRWSDAHAGHSTLEQAWEHLAVIQVRRRRTLGVFGVLLAALLPFFSSAWSADSLVFQFTRMAGLALVLAAVLGRCWCMLYLGGHKGASLITQGPYSVSRNPLYGFSLCAVAGMGALSGSLLLGPVMALFVYAVFNNVIDEEEILLQRVFGSAYEDYCRRVPRLGPRLSLWRSPDELQVSVSGLARTLRDALPYFLIWPIFELAQRAQVHGWVPVLLHLP